MDQYLEQAIATNAPEIVNQVMAQRRRELEFNSRTAYAKSMVQAKECMPAIAKTKEVKFSAKGGRTYYKHAELSEIVASVVPWLAKFGFSHNWNVEQAENTIRVSCVLTHHAGHSEVTSITSPHDLSGSKNAIQAVGSAITYLQRYTLLAATGLAAGTDDDGVATGKTVDRISVEQSSAVAKLLVDSGTVMEDFLSHYGITSLQELPATEYANAVQILQRKISKMGA